MLHRFNSTQKIGLPIGMRMHVTEVPHYRDNLQGG